MRKKTMGISIEKGKINCVVMEGSCLGDCHVVDKKVIVFNVQDSRLMTQFSNFFIELLTQYTPDVVAYKLADHDRVVNEQIPYLYCSVGILSYLCESKGIAHVPMSSKMLMNRRSNRIGKFKTNFYGQLSNHSKGVLEAGAAAWFGGFE